MDDDGWTISLFFLGESDRVENNFTTTETTDSYETLSIQKTTTIGSSTSSSSSSSSNKRWLWTLLGIGGALFAIISTLFVIIWQCTKPKTQTNNSELDSDNVDTISNISSNSAVSDVTKSVAPSKSIR